MRAVSEDPQITSVRSHDDYTKNTVHMLGQTSMHPAFMDLAYHPVIVSCIQALLGPDIQLQHSKLATKPPTKGAGVFPWHQDYMFYPHTNTDLLSVMVMLDVQRWKTAVCKWSKKAIKRDFWTERCACPKRIATRASRSVTPGTRMASWPKKKLL